MEIGDEVVLTNSRRRGQRATVIGRRGVLFVLKLDNGPQLRVPASMIRSADTPAPQMEPEPIDFDKGFGIGGLGRYQPTAAEEMALLDQQIAYAERERRRVRRGPLPHGQLWEPCPICGREPVCVDCGLCRDHCDC